MYCTLWGWYISLSIRPRVFHSKTQSLLALLNPCFKTGVKYCSSPLEHFTIPVGVNVLFDHMNMNPQDTHTNRKSSKSIRWIVQGTTKRHKTFQIPHTIHQGTMEVRNWTPDTLRCANSPIRDEPTHHPTSRTQTQPPRHNNLPFKSNWFQVLLTSFTRYFSTFLQSTCSLSV